MKLVGYYNSEDTFLYDEVIVALEEFSKWGGKLSEVNPRPGMVLEWDRLMKGEELEQSLQLFSTLPELLRQRVRVLDLGVAMAIKNHFPQVKLQIVVEHTAHNLHALLAYQEFFGSQCERLVLSVEIPAKKLQELMQKISLPLEIMGIGKILLFYSPRALLSPRLGEKVKSAFAKSEESVHRDFILQETDAGTLMFHHKDFSLLEQLKDIEEMQLPYLRLDLRSVEGKDLREKIFTWVKNPKRLESEWPLIASEYPLATTQGFFRTNKTQVLFKKLKNIHLERSKEEEELYIGEVIEAKKGEYLAISLVGASLKQGENVSVRDPHGKMHRLVVRHLRDLFGEEKIEALKGETVLINYAKGITSRSMLFFDGEKQKSIL